MIERAVIIRSLHYNGSMFDAFEYFYRLWEQDKSVKFVSLSPHINQKFLQIKYQVNSKCFDNFIYDDPYNLEFNKVLMFDTYNFGDNKTNMILKSDKIYVISNSSKRFKGNVEYFDEYFLNKNYINKIYYQIQRKFKRDIIGNKTYINAMDKNNLLFLKLCKENKNIIVKDDLSNFQNYKLTKGFVPNLFELINKYIYIKTEKTTDRHPRMFTECAYQGIECEYYHIGDKFANNDNSWYRFQDRFDFEKRCIFEDEVINKILD